MHTASWVYGALEVLTLTSWQVVQALLAAGAAADAANIKGATPLHAAAGMGYLEVSDACSCQRRCVPYQLHS